MALGQVSHHNQVPVWKRHERGDLIAAIIGCDRSLRDAALDAYQDGWPATVVAWAAQRAWAQSGHSTPSGFMAILMNHANDTYNQLGEMLNVDT